MSTGKIPYTEALNGSNVLLPCTYTSCIGISKLYVKWESNINGTIQKVRLLRAFCHRTSVERCVKDFHSEKSRCRHSYHEM